MTIEIRQPKSFSEIGRKDNQEDYLWPMPESVTEKNRIFLMCDGIGGHDNGEVASKTAATAIGEYLTEHTAAGTPVTKELFEQALAYGYEALDKVDNGAAKKMGTTMTCLVLHENGALVAHMGDSRIYHVRPSLADANGRTGIIYQSADHSLVNDLLRLGEITEEEAVNFPQKNVITRAMQPNMERRHKADIFNIEDVQMGDYFFLCCDGVLEQVTNEKLGAILSDATLDDEGKIRSIKQICDGNTKDNYTCWLVPIDKVDGCVVKSEEEVVVVEVVEDQPAEVAKDVVADSAASRPQTPSRPVSTAQPISHAVDVPHTEERIGNKNKGLLLAILLLVVVALVVLVPKLRASQHEEDSELVEQMDSSAMDKQNAPVAGKGKKSETKKTEAPKKDAAASGTSSEDVTPAAVKPSDNGEEAAPSKQESTSIWSEPKVTQ